jgi:hypothetical protein
MTIDGLGFPFDTALYGQPGFHTGVDFYAPDGSSVYSIGGNGLVVGIGVGESFQGGNLLDIEGKNFSSHEWGSAGVQVGQTGYSVIIRYGHLYVLYGHLRDLDPAIFVGAPVQIGAKIGSIGSYNDPHVHIEVRNFVNPIPQIGLQSSPMRQFGFTSFSSTAINRAIYHYDVTQFFDSSLTMARLSDTDLTQTPVTNLGVSLINGMSIYNSVCSREYRHATTVPTVNDSFLSGNIRGFIQLENLNATPIPPSQAPNQP